MNAKAVSEALEIVSRRRAEAVSNYEKHVDEIEKAIPEISYLNQEMAATSRNVIFAALKDSDNIGSKINSIRRANVEAQRRTRELLERHGYPLNYLDIQYSCTKCCDTGFRGDSNEYCDCVTKLINQIAANYVNKNNTLKLFSFDTFKTDVYSKTKVIPKLGKTEYEIMCKVFNNCRKYVDYFQPSNPNLLMIGGTGLGKTHLSLSIAKGILEQGYGVIYNSAIDIFSAIEREKFSRYNASSDTLDAILIVDLLIIDDLGVEIDNKFYRSILYNIINTRFIYNRATIINTNCTIKELQDKYEDRILSRLMAYQTMNFYGTDLRYMRSISSENL